MNKYNKISKERKMKMSKIKNYDRALYESIEAGLRAVIRPYRFTQLGQVLALTYTPKHMKKRWLFFA